MKFSKFHALALALTLCTTVPVQSAFVFQNGRLIDSSEAATMSVQEHFDAAVAAYEKQDWQEAGNHFNIVKCSFPSTVYAQEAYFYLGVCDFYLQEYDFANNAFTQYLKVQSNPRLFQEVIDFKMAIADLLAGGAKCRFFGTRQLPKWANGKDLAVEIYNEIAAAVPCHEIAAQALVSKGYLLWTMQDFKGAIESFQMVIRRFPKHEFAPECYLLISKVYLDQCQYEYQNPDILAFAQINLRRFERDFPREERLCQARDDVMYIQEIYAGGLYELGRFYERKCRKRAAIIYYKNTIHQFPDTVIADRCRERLICIDPCYQPEPVQTPEAAPALDEKKADAEDLEGIDFN